MRFGAGVRVVRFGNWIVCFGIGGSRTVVAVVVVEEVGGKKVRKRGKGTNPLVPVHPAEFNKRN